MRCFAFQVAQGGTTIPRNTSPCLDPVAQAERTCYYTQNPNSMMHTIYNCAFFVAIKKPSRGWNPGLPPCSFRHPALFRVQITPHRHPAGAPRVQSVPRALHTPCRRAHLSCLPPLTKHERLAAAPGGGAAGSSPVQMGGVMGGAMGTQFAGAPGTQFAGAPGTAGRCRRKREECVRAGKSAAGSSAITCRPTRVFPIVFPCLPKARLTCLSYRQEVECLQVA